MSALQALGQELREARQRRDLSLPEVEQRIHIRVKFLDALEKGEAAALPSPAQTRGFLRNYARFLGLDGDAIVARWEEGLHGKPRRRGRVAPAVRSATPTADSPGRGRRLPLLIFIMLCVVALGVLAILGAQELQTASMILSPAPPTDTPGTLSALGSETPAATESLIPLPSPLPNPNAPATLPTRSGDSANSGEVVVQIEVVARTWLRVQVDGAVAYLGAPGPNTVLQYRGRQVNIRAANAAGLRVVVNDRDLGIVGARGQIFDQTFP